MTGPYYDDGQVQLWLGDCRDVIPALGLQADLVVADPPYAETSLAWDRWPDGWVQVAATVSSSMWCFGSMRMFLDRRDEFAGWKLSQDVVWEKQNGTGIAADRFRRVHELALQWYRGDWRTTHHAPVRERYDGPHRGVRTGGADRGEHLGTMRFRRYEDDGTRLMRSVLRMSNTHKQAIHPTQKPVGILTPLIEYGCPPAGLVLDPFAGSASTLVAARETGRRAIGIEADEKYAERAALRLAQAPLELA